MVLGFDFESWYATLIYILGGLLVLVAALEKVYGWSRWVHRLFRPKPAAPPSRAPVIVLGGPSYSLSVETLQERRLEKTRLLTCLAVSYLIENKEAAVTVTAKLIDTAVA